MKNRRLKGAFRTQSTTKCSCIRKMKKNEWPKENWKILSPFTRGPNPPWESAEGVVLIIKLSSIVQTKNVKFSGNDSECLHAKSRTYLERKFDN